MRLTLHIWRQKGPQSEGKMVRYVLPNANPEMSMLDSAVGSQRATLKVGQYANEGVLVIDVWKSGAVNV